MHNNYIYILIMAAVTLAIRILPLTLLRRRIESPFIQSFLYYVPYVTLAVMTFPAIVDESGTPLAGYVALVCGIIAARKGVNMFTVAVICCVLVFLINLLP